MRQLSTLIIRLRKDTGYAEELMREESLIIGSISSSQSYCDLLFNIGMFSLALLTGVRDVFGVGVVNLISRTTARASHIINYKAIYTVSKYCQILSNM